MLNKIFSGQSSLFYLQNSNFILLFDSSTIHKMTNTSQTTAQQIFAINYISLSIHSFLTRDIILRRQNLFQQIICVLFIIMYKFNALGRRLVQFGSKKIISLKPVRIDSIVQQIKGAEQRTKPEKQHPSQRIPDNWELLQFDKLCSLNSNTLHQLEILIKKTKMNVTDQMFSSEHEIADPESQLTPYWVHIYKTLCNLKPISQNKVEQIRKQAYLARMYLDQPEKDEKLIQVIQRFVGGVHDVTKLQGVAEPTFCKYLLSLKRDLLMQGLNIATYVDEKQKTVKIIQILSYQYEFWVDVKHNRGKNGTEEDFIVIKKAIKNPNTTLILTEQYPEINLTYITRKKKSKEIQMNFVVKMMILIEVNDNKHLIKVQKKGPSSEKINKQLRNEYLVIDYDTIFKGNPTVRPIFQF